MIPLFLSLLVILPATLLFDAFARPRAGTLLRSGAGSLLLVLMTLFGFGVLLGFSGNPALAAILVLAFHLLLVVASNAKNRMLGEPLLFSDLALVGAVFRHPQFYFSALGRSQKIGGIATLALLAAAFVCLFEEDMRLRVSGLAIGLLALALLGLCLRTDTFRRLAAEPSADTDVATLGLASTLLLYWMRWRSDAAGSDPRGSDPSPFQSNATVEFGDGTIPEIIVVVQCESFSDPRELFGERGAELPLLASARREALLWGDLLVSGFGAYTMRTEYGVLFGQEEEALGFRRYDPYLTAIGEGSLALPNRLGTDRWRSFFVHPHDMRFYSRHRILPRAGFSKLIDESEFDKPSPDESRYVKDTVVADKILEVARGTASRAFIYAVTIENHGPWSGQDEAAHEPLLTHYNGLVQAGDAMLGQLRDGIASLGRPAVLAFFGDHRPSIPGASEPGGDRHTPYVVLQFDAKGQIVPGSNRRENITPAQLHHAILALSRESGTR
ncbi:LTA synthase family protein [Qipengyuania qiaonensis]|uniref:LTA synthase family protein n=1 Tax=Qipengyuania qiaonensis TaxID=2867240 RepID=A0ABS7J3T7_9SPHN|nr:LTA synthase family protein [Qipengyuania qiaonensis]MBX7481989.1 LTA synthase family protein [Qipengyuania qiaonensis]